MTTKTFPLRVVLTVTTGRLLTEPRGPNDNGIDDLYEILGWMTDEQPYTHSLPRFGDECRPWLLKWFPELGPCSTKSAMESLDKWIAADKTNTAQEGIKMWLAELKMMFPALKDHYEVGKIHIKHHKKVDAEKELIELMEDKSRVIRIEH